MTAEEEIQLLKEQVAELRKEVDALKVNKKSKSYWKGKPVEDLTEEENAEMIKEFKSWAALRSI